MDTVEAREHRTHLWAWFGRTSPVLRWVAIAGIVVISAVSAIFSAEQYLRTIQPSAVDRVTVQLIRELGVSAEPNAMAMALLRPHPSASVATAARKALNVDPLNAGLLRLLAFAQPNSPTGQAARERLIVLSNRVSRRDGALQLWFVLDAAQKNDGPVMMAHLDTLIRSHPETAPIVFQALSTGLAEPKFRDTIARSLAQRPPWLADFLIAVIPNSQHPELLAQTVTRLNRLPRSPDLDSAWSQLLHKLADTGHSSELRAVFERLPQARRELLTTVELPRDEAEALLAPVSWHLIQNADYSATLISQGGRNAIEVFLAGDLSGTLARKVVFLAPGSHSVGFELKSGTGRPRMGLVTRCLDGGAILATTPLEPVSDMRRSIPFVTTASCPAVMIELQVAGDENGTDSSFLASNFSLGN